MKMCKKCNSTFEPKQYNQVRCDKCKVRQKLSLETRQARTERHNATFVARRLKLIEDFGHRCARCGYNECVEALEFHHVDASTKIFSLTTRGFSKSPERVKDEAKKCILLCANCHREEHNVVGDTKYASKNAQSVASYRKQTKIKAIDYKGGRCQICAGLFTPAVFEFHHIDPLTKKFAVSGDGITRAWARIQEEVDKCLLLCANCHRQVHATKKGVDPNGGL